VNTTEVASLLTQIHSMRPQDALASTSEDARMLVEWTCLMTVYFASESSSRLSRNSGVWRFDEDSQRFVSRQPELVVPKSSLRLDADGRLCGFSYGDVPLEEIVFELRSEAFGWRALGVSQWSNTTISWFAGNAQAFEQLGVLRGRRPTSDLGEGSCFVVGDQRHPAVGFVASLKGDAAVVRVHSTPLHRDTLGEHPLRLTLELPGSIEVTLIGTRVPRMVHAFEVDLRSRRTSNTKRDGTAARSEASPPTDES
jgi:hypothetical protein